MLSYDAVFLTYFPSGFVLTYPLGFKILLIFTETGGRENTRRDVRIIIGRVKCARLDLNPPIAIVVRFGIESIFKPFLSLSVSTAACTRRYFFSFLVHRVFIFKPNVVKPSRRGCCP